MLIAVGLVKIITHVQVYFLKAGLRTLALLMRSLLQNDSIEPVRR